MVIIVKQRIMHEQDELYHSCSRYIRCSVNNCPLYSKYPCYIDENDRYKECTLMECQVKDIKRRKKNNNKVANS